MLVCLSIDKTTERQILSKLITIRHCSDNWLSRPQGMCRKLRSTFSCSESSVWLVAFRRPVTQTENAREIKISLQLEINWACEDWRRISARVRARFQIRMFSTHFPNIYTFLICLLFVEPVDTGWRLAENAEKQHSRVLITGNGSWTCYKRSKPLCDTSHCTRE